MACTCDVDRRAAFITRRRHDLYAVAGFLARTKSRLLRYPLEDLLGVIDQPKFPHRGQNIRIGGGGCRCDRQIASAIDIPALKAATGEADARGRSDAQTISAVAGICPQELKTMG